MNIDRIDADISSYERAINGRNNTIAKLKIAKTKYASVFTELDKFDKDNVILVCQNLRRNINNKISAIDNEIRNLESLNKNAEEEISTLEQQKKDTMNE